MYAAELDEVLSKVLRVVRSHPLLRVAIAVATPKGLIASQEKSRSWFRRAVAGEWPACAAGLRELGGAFAAAAIPFGGWCDLFSCWQSHMIPALVRAFASEGDRLAGALMLSAQLADWVAVTVGEGYLATREGALAGASPPVAEGPALESASASSRERTRLLIDSITDHAIFMLDSGGRVTSWNAGARAIHGYESKEILGQSFSVFYPDGARSEGKPERDLALAAALGRHEDEGWRVRKDLSTVWANVVITALHDTSGKLVGFGLIARDSSDREPARQSRRTRPAKTSLQDASRFLDSIVENIPYMVFVKEANELRFARINRAGEQLLGVTRADLLGKNDYDFFPKEQADFFQAQDRLTLDRGRIVDIPEEPIETKNGRRWLHTRKVPLQDASGLPQYLLGISEDITERKQIAEALRLAKESAEAASSELESFSFSVAHDLRAPLRAIDGFSRALLEDCADRLDDDGRRHVQRVRSATQRMGHVIDGLLALSRVARSQLRFELVDLSAIAAASYEDLRQLAEERAPSGLAVRIAPSLTDYGDPRLLRIVLDNLLGNAIKFTAKRARATIEFGARMEGTERIYFVRDDGVGFDARNSDRLFGPFQRLHDASEYPGTGIGLATVHRVVGRHGGRIWAQSEPDRGATFSFTLGRTRPTNPEATS